MTTESVAKPNLAWSGMAENWYLTASLWGGTPSMREARTTYLPLEPAESLAAYERRLARSVLTNIYKDTVQRLAGKPLKAPVSLSDDVPQEIHEYKDNIDNLGNDLDVFSRNLLEAAINDGLTHILVDYPRVEGAEDQTLAQQDATGARPYAVHVKAKSILGWKSATINGEEVLTQVRIEEWVNEPDPDDEFTENYVQQIRVVEPMRVRIFRQMETSSKKTEWQVWDEYTTTADFVPLVTLYANQTGFMEGEPVLLDMAYLNVAHWQSDSDQRNILHVARVPILFGIGLTDDPDRSIELDIGANTVVNGPVGSDLKYVEVAGNAIEAGRKDLESLEARMGLIGMDMLVRKPGNATATARALDQGEQDSALGAIARALESALDTMLDYFAFWLGLGKDAGGNTQVFKDFGISMRDAEDVKQLTEMRVNGDISRQTYWDEMKRRGLLSDDFDPENEYDLLEIETTEDQRLDNFETFNNPGDVSGQGGNPPHVHTLEEDGYTNTVNGHRHTWTKQATETGPAGEDGHTHPLQGQGEAGLIEPQQQQQGGQGNAVQTLQ